MADWSLPVLATGYADTLTGLRGRDEDAAKMFDGVGSNLPVGTIKWNSSASKWEKYDGAVWGDLTAKYMIDVDTVDGLHGTQFLRSDTSGTLVGALNVTGKVTNGGFDFILGSYDQSTRGDTGLSRALVKNYGGVLIINYAGDFYGGVEFQGPSLKFKGYDVLYKGDMGSGSGLDADLLDGLQGSDYLTIGNQYTIKRYKTPGDTDLNWKVLYEVSMDDTTYEACLIRVDHSVVKTNYGHNAEVENYTFYVSMRRSDGTVNGLDDAVIYGNNVNLGVLKVIKRATGDYVVLVRPSDIDRNDQITSQILSIGSGTTATYYDTPTDGSTITGTEYFPILRPIPWTNITTLLNGWAFATDGYARAYVDENGFVHIEAYNLNGASAVDDDINNNLSTIFTLPTNMAHSNSLVFSAGVWNSYTSDIEITQAIVSGANVRTNLIGVSGKYISFTVSYYVGS